MKKVLTLSIMALFAISTVFAQGPVKIVKKPQQTPTYPTTTTEAKEASSEDKNATLALPEDKFGQLEQLNKQTSKAVEEQNTFQTDINDKFGGLKNAAARIEEQQKAEAGVKKGLEKFNERAAKKRAEKEKKQAIENDIKAAINSIQQDAEKLSEEQNTSINEVQGKAPKPIIDYVKENYEYDYIGAWRWDSEYEIYEVDLYEKRDNRFYGTIYLNSQMKQVSNNPRNQAPKPPRKGSNPQNQPPQKATNPQNQPSQPKKSH